VSNYIEEVLKKSEAQTKAEIDDYFGRLNRYLGKGRRADPIKELEHDMKEIDRLISDPATSPEKLQELIEAKAEIRLKHVKDFMGEATNVVKSTAEQMGDSWSNAWDTMLDDLLEFNKSGKELVGDLVTSILKDMARLELKKAVQPLIEAGKNWLVEAIGGMFGSKDGSAYTAGGVRAFANGGVVDSPTGFSYNGGRSAGVMGEAGAEAIMPLRRGADGKLGVAAPTVSVTVINGTNGKARTEEKTDSNGNREIVVLIEEVVEGALGGGRMDNVLSNSFGVQRKGK
jgi:phage-related minor tail protein